MHHCHDRLASCSALCLPPLPPCPVLTLSFSSGRREAPARAHQNRRRQLLLESRRESAGLSGILIFSAPLFFAMLFFFGFRLFEMLRFCNERCSLMSFCSRGLSSLLCAGARQGRLGVCPS